MATHNSINSNIPIEVTKGGTGSTTLTNHAVLVGATTSTTSLAVGTTGQLLVAATGADPAFASSAAQDFTFTTATAGTTRSLVVSNTDNSNTNSGAVLQVSTGGASGGNPVVQYLITGVTTFLTGLDNTSSDSYKIAIGSSFSGNEGFIMTTSGERTLPKQPAFLAYMANDVSNVTGDGTAYTVLFDTKVFDIGTHYDTSTGAFTAPVTGKYDLNSTILWLNVTSSSVFTGGSLVINTSNRAYTCAVDNPGKVFENTPHDVTITGSTLADMDAADTVTIIATVTGSSKTVSVDGAAAPTSFFSGSLIC